MPRDGSGNYTRPAGQPVTTGTVIDASVFNTLTADLATALTGSIPRDGQAPPTANLPMGGFKLTGLANGSAAADSITLGQAQSLDSAVAATAQSGSAQWLTSVSGTNTITGNASPAIAAYAAGQTFRFVPANTNTGATTLQINGVGSAQNVFAFGAACVGGELVAGVPVTVVHDGTRFNVLSLGTQPGLEKIGVYTASAAATFDIETGISATRYIGYLLDIHYLYPSTNATTLRMRIKRGGAYQTTAYSTMHIYTNSSAFPATPVLGATGGLANDGWDVSTTTSSSNVPAEALSGTITFPNPHDSTSYMKATGHVVWVGSGGGTNVGQVGGYYGTGGGLQGIRFFSSSGNINGKVSLYGMRA